MTSTCLHNFIVIRKMNDRPAHQEHPRGSIIEESLPVDEAKEVKVEAESTFMIILFCCDLHSLIIPLHCFVLITN